MKTVKFTPDPHQKPQLSDHEEAALASLSDEEIDYSDIEELEVVFPEADIILGKKRSKK